MKFLIIIVWLSSGEVHLSILQAYNMIKKTEVQFEQVEFFQILEKTNKFIECMNGKHDEIDIIIESEFPNKRRRISRKMFN